MDPAQFRPAVGRYCDRDSGTYFCDCWQCDFILRDVSKSTYDRHTQALAGPLATTTKRKTLSGSAAPDPKRTRGTAGSPQETFSGDGAHNSGMPFVHPELY
jgi:hypothetical protein